jgi:hypothetical protein
LMGSARWCNSARTTCSAPGQAEVR